MSVADPGGWRARLHLFSPKPRAPPFLQILDPLLNVIMSYMYYRQLFQHFACIIQYQVMEDDDKCMSSWQWKYINVTDHLSTHAA